LVKRQTHWLDNDGVHKTTLIHRWRVKRPQLHLHFTPAGTSWIDRVERWFALITETSAALRLLQHARVEIRSYIGQHNKT
jgi:hypothetical protein